MAIIVNGYEHRTLSQPLYVNGKRVMEAYANGVKVYPDDGIRYVTYTTILTGAIDRELADAVHGEGYVHKYRRFTGRAIIVIQHRVMDGGYTVIEDGVGPRTYGSADEYVRDALAIERWSMNGLLEGAYGGLDRVPYTIPSLYRIRDKYSYDVLISRLRIFINASVDGLSEDVPQSWRTAAIGIMGKNLAGFYNNPGIGEIPWYAFDAPNTSAGRHSQQNVGLSANDFGSSKFPYSIFGATLRLTYRQVSLAYHRRNFVATVPFTRVLWSNLPNGGNHYGETPPKELLGLDFDSLDDDSLFDYL
jgi:hypothetical protein